MRTNGEGAAITAEAPSIAVDRSELVEHRPALLAAARAIVLNDAEAEDLVQTTLEIAIRRIDQLRNPDALRAWLFAIQTRQAFRLLRRLRRLVSLERVVREIEMNAGVTADHIAVHSALATLPLRTRAAVVLHHMVGLSVAETAVALGTSPNTVKTQLREGLARLRRELADDR